MLVVYCKTDLIFQKIHKTTSIYYFTFIYQFSLKFSQYLKTEFLLLSK